MFSAESRDCALQLWILQIHFAQSTENRIVYGRLLPYNHSSSRWFASDDDSSEAFGEIRAQIPGSGGAPGAPNTGNTAAAANDSSMLLFAALGIGGFIMLSAGSAVALRRRD